MEKRKPDFCQIFLNGKFVVTHGFDFACDAWRRSCFAVVTACSSEAGMKIGVFIPIGNNGWLISENSPQYRPSFALNKQITLTAEHYGLDFVLSMIKLRGFGGKTEFWDHNLESFTLMAGLAAVTTRIKLFATCATLAIPPAIAARMASTIDSISDGRFGLNLITGWQKPEYSQMGLWPGDEYFAPPLRVCVRIHPDHARAVGNRPLRPARAGSSRWRTAGSARARRSPMKIICAGQSDAGMAFSAQYADYNFCFGKGVNTPTAFAPTVAKLNAGQPPGPAATSRAYALFMIIADETDEAARAKWESLQGRHRPGSRRLAGASSRPPTSPRASDTNVRQMVDPVSVVNINMGTLVGSFETVAGLLDEVATVPGCDGVLLTFDDFIKGTEDFGARIQPLMKSRQHALETA